MSRDLEGDGATDEDVLHAFDRAQQKLVNTWLERRLEPRRRQERRRGAHLRSVQAIGAPEPPPTRPPPPRLGRGRDLDGDGDHTDEVLHRAQVRSLARARSPCPGWYPPFGSDSGGPRTRGMPLDDESENGASENDESVLRVVAPVSR